LIDGPAGEQQAAGRAVANVNNNNDNANNDNINNANNDGVAAPVN